MICTWTFTIPFATIPACYVKALNPDCFVPARTRFSKELDELYAYGADGVIQEEFEAGLAMLVRALKALNVKSEDIEREAQAIRVERDELTMRTASAPLFSPGKFLPRGLS